MDAAQQTLRLIRKGNPNESMTVGAYPFSIGRGRDSSYRIPDMKVSSKYETSRNMQNTDTCPPVLPSPLSVCFCASPRIDLITVSLMLVVCLCTHFDRHCILHLERDGDSSCVVLEDLSTFGTFVNGVRCKGLTRIHEGFEVALTVDYRPVPCHAQAFCFSPLGPRADIEGPRMNNRYLAEFTSLRKQDSAEADHAQEAAGGGSGSKEEELPDSILTPWGVRLRRSLVRTCTVCVRLLSVHESMGPLSALTR